VTTPELIIALRELLDDEQQPFLWKDSALVRYLNDAERQACRRAYLVIDRNTASICNISLTASTASYTLHSKVLQMRRIAVGSSDTPLLIQTKEEVDYLFNIGGMDWASYPAGIPEIVITEANNELIFFPPPQSADVAYLEVARLPKVDLTNDDTSSPEIPLLYHEDLILWGAHRAFMKNDSDSVSVALAREYEQKFTDRFGPLPSARSERFRKSQSMRQKARPKEFGYL
jgi:hypothetical protein